MDLELLDARHVGFVYADAALVDVDARVVVRCLTAFHAGSSGRASCHCRTRGIRVREVLEDLDPAEGLAADDVGRLDTIYLDLGRTSVGASRSFLYSSLATAIIGGGMTERGPGQGGRGVSKTPCVDAAAQPGFTWQLLQRPSVDFRVLLQGLFAHR